MTTTPPVLLVLDFAGTFAFALNGAMTAVRATRLDIVGVVALGLITALGGGMLRDVLIGSTPPAAFEDWRYLTLAVTGGLVVFVLSQWLTRWETPIVVLDAIGLSTFAVIGASKALAHGIGVGPAILLGAITAVGGGTIRDLLILRVPTVLRSDLYAIPALLAAAVAAGAIRLDLYGLPAAMTAVSLCFLVRMLGVRYNLQAPLPPGGKE